jgi:hypothetical protein
MVVEANLIRLHDAGYGRANGWMQSMLPFSLKDDTLAGGPSPRRSHACAASILARPARKPTCEGRSVSSVVTLRQALTRISCQSLG